MPFSLETSRYAPVAKALRYETAFSTTPESENSLAVKNQGKIKREKRMCLPPHLKRKAHTKIGG